MTVGHSSSWLGGIDGETQPLRLWFSCLRNGMVIPSSLAVEKQKRNEASKCPATLGGGILAPDLPAGHHGPNGMDWPFGARVQPPVGKSSGDLLPSRGSWWCRKEVC